jgi:hypothetical protein
MYTLDAQKRIVGFQARPVENPLSRHTAEV